LKDVGDRSNLTFQSPQVEEMQGKMLTMNNYGVVENSEGNGTHKKGNWVHHGVFETVEDLFGVPRQGWCPGDLLDQNSNHEIESFFKQHKYLTFAEGSDFDLTHYLGSRQPRDAPTDKECVILLFIEFKGVLCLYGLIRHVGAHAIFPTRSGPLSLLGTDSVEDRFNTNDPDDHKRALTNLWKLIRGDFKGRNNGNYGIDEEVMDLQKVLFVTRKTKPEQPEAVGDQKPKPPVDQNNEPSQHVPLEVGDGNTVEDHEVIDLSQSTPESSSDDDTSSTDYESSES